MKPENAFFILFFASGAECSLVRNDNGSYRVKISATATKIVAELRRPIEELMKGTIIDHPGITPTVLQLLLCREGITLMKSIGKETGTYFLLDRNTFTLRVFGICNKIEVAKEKLVKSLLALHESKQQEVHLRGASLPPDLMKRVVQRFGPDLQGLKEKFPDAVFALNTKRHCISICGTKDLRQRIEGIVYEIAEQASGLPPRQKGDDDEATCPICLCEVEDGYKLEGCGHKFCRSCLLEQCECAIKNRDGFPVRCAHKACGDCILITDLRSLLTCEKLDELFRASLSAYVAGSNGTYRFCPSPDCPSVYRVGGDSEDAGLPFVCGACLVETCTRCHLEYHPYLTCREYQMFKKDPDSSFTEWCLGKENVKKCPVCNFTIEKVEGCDHIQCRCGKHVCWACLEFFSSSDDCYTHLRSIHDF